MTDDRQWSDPAAWMRLFHDQFLKESDRASVILAAAILDDTLSVLLRSYLVPNATQDDDLFESPTAPLAAFSARIDFAYRIGLVSKRLCRDLHLVRKIRNDFAHNVTGCSFEDSTVRNRVTELRKSFSGLTDDDEHLSTFGDNPRGHFQIVVGWLVWYLRGQIAKCGHLTEAGEEWGYRYEKIKADRQQPNLGMQPTADGDP